MTRRLSLLLVILVLGAQAVDAQDSAVPVAGIDQAYHAGRLVDGEITPSTDAAYEGEPLRLQTTRVGSTASEPTIGVDTDGVAFYAALAGTTDVRKSTDGGLTWTSVQPKIGPVDSPPVTLDPYVYVDEETGRVFNLELTLACSWLNMSDNQGASWTTNPLACGSFVNDHQTIVAADPVPPMQTVGYPNVLYYCF